MYRNEHLEEVGLTGLTTIIRGGVRVNKNPLLCYVDTVDWGAMVAPEYLKHVKIYDNEGANVCPDFCPSHCESLAGAPTGRAAGTRRRARGSRSTGAGAG